MKIEIWTDFTCPFCYIGKRKLEIAIEQFPYKDIITVEWISFPLEALNDAEMAMDQWLMEKHGYAETEIESTWNQLFIEAKELGLPLKRKAMQYVDTYDAHRLLQLAKKQKKDNVFVDRLFQSYFGEELPINNKAVLREIALHVGLEEEVVDETLSMNCFAKAVAADIQLAEEIGIQTAPFFVFEEKYAVQGYQSEQSFLQILHDVWEQEGWSQRPTRKVDLNERKYCIGNECDI